MRAGREIRGVAPRRGLCYAALERAARYAIGGTWCYDKSFLSQEGNSFEARKAGTVRETYTIGSQSAYVDLIITKVGVPQTGDTRSAALWLPTLVVCIAARRWRCAKKHKRTSLFKSAVYIK